MILPPVPTVNTEVAAAGQPGPLNIASLMAVLEARVEPGAVCDALREAAADTMIVASGFSCSEQIAQSTPRQALHIAEVAALVLHRSHGAETANR